MIELKTHLVRIKVQDYEFVNSKGYNISKLVRQLVSEHVTQERKKEELLYAVQQPNYPRE